MSVPIFPEEVRQSISGSQLLALLKPYGLNKEAVNLTLLKGGLRNACFLVRTRKQKYVLYLYQPGGSSDRRLLEVMSLQTYLYNHGWPVPQVVLTQDGLYFFYQTILGCPRRVALFSYIRGWTLPSYLPRHLFTAGKALSDLHAETRYYPRKKHLPCLSRFEGEQTTVLHGDFARANLLFGNHRLCGILDFESAASGPAVSDIARSLSLFFLDHPNLIEDKIRRPFLEGYAAGKSPLPDLGDLPKLEEVFLSSSILSPF